jgi:pseudouridylate synthase
LFIFFMKSTLPSFVVVHPEVQAAQAQGLGVVALESTVITHGLPYPESLQLARDMETEVRQAGACPATVAVLGGKLCIGLQDDELERLARTEDAVKVSGRDIARAVMGRRSGGTTVAATMIAAHTAGIRVFATGGIGGVHREVAYDISADLMELARLPLVVVCAGAKAILDLPAILEMLETLGVPVAGFQTDEFPAFYSPGSGLPVSARVNSAREVVELALAHWEMGLSSAILLAQPPPQETALPPEIIRAAVDRALDELRLEGIRGQAVTPFLLRRVSELTGGLSLQANLALLRNNARLAAQVASAFASHPK